jgi:signal transduction histidine kinase/CheY-like chemotaxis protein/ligand-binding sensor domain-containing protein/AraC-like DNA-binding protein
VPGSTSLSNLSAPGFRVALSRRLLLRALSALLVLCPLSLHAQKPLLPVFHFNKLPLEIYKFRVTSQAVRDPMGFVWYGCGAGLMRYDGYSFKIYGNNSADPFALPSNSIRSLLVDTKGRLWIGTGDKGLFLYDFARDRFIKLIPDREDTTHYALVSVNSLIEDRSGNIWVAMFPMPFSVIRVKLPAQVGPDDLDTLARRLQFTAFHVDSIQNELTALCERTDGKIVVGSRRGILIIDPEAGTVSRPQFPDHVFRLLDTAVVNCVLERPDRTTWVGTATQGVFRLDWDIRNVVNYRHHSGDSLTIKNDEIWALAEDRGGNLWIGTQVDLVLFSTVTGMRLPYLTIDPPPLIGEYVAFSFDRTGTFWVGSMWTLYRLSPRSRLFPNVGFVESGIWETGERTVPRSSTFHTIRRTSGGDIWGVYAGKLVKINLIALTVEKVSDLFEVTNRMHRPGGPKTSIIDKKGNFWYAAFDDGLFGINPTTGAVSNFKYESGLSNHNSIISVAEGSGDSLWIGAGDQGVFRFDPASGKFVHTDFNYGSSVMRARDGKIWITGLDGLYILDPGTGVADRFVNIPSDPHSLTQTSTMSTYEDAMGRIWVEAGSTVHLWNPSTRSFTRFQNPAFEEEWAVPLCADDKRRLWIVHNRGISILDPSNGKYINIGYDDGLPLGISGIENLGDGRMLLSGAAGLSVVFADSMKPDRTPPTLALTRMTINDEPVVPPLLKEGAASLRLSYRQDVLEFEFASFDYDGRGPVEYRYQLEGLEKDWVKPADRRYVRYTGVPPGDYVFKVRASSAWDRWPDQDIRVAVSIAPPWWKATWAYGGYLVLMTALLYAGYRIRMRQVHLQQEVKLEHFQREHLAEVDRLKSQFFANISHEFRTPLTLILGPMGKLQSKVPDEESRRTLDMMKRNAHRLLRLINQLLDLSKLEAGAMKLRASRMDIVPLTKGIACSFESSAGMGGIDLQVIAEQEEIEVYVDKDKFEKILTNVLSNAFKFTKEGGAVTVTLSPLPPLPNRERGSEGVRVSVADTGIGIPPEQLEKVFDRFYQVDASQTREYEGSGLGLALVKELVELHHGTIQVQSEVGRGTTFTVLLPIGRSHLKDEEIVDGGVSEEAALHEGEVAAADYVSGKVREEVEPEHVGDEKPIVLVVEDNADVRAYIREYLVAEYHVTEAKDGAEGIEKAQEAIPDLVISDVMMPKKDGYEVCRTLKRDERTSHIPVILLTAKAAGENKIEGLETGADDYLIKPFDPKELLTRVRNLLELRRRLRERFSASIPLKPGEIAATSMDDAFLIKAMAAVEKNIGDEHFHVLELGAAVGMSRVQLHRKLIALTNQGPGEFIRYLRLHRGMDLLLKDAGTVAEIAYSVGFSDPSAFSKSFHKQFGIAPTEVKRSPAKPVSEK